MQVDKGSFHKGEKTPTGMAKDNKELLSSVLGRYPRGSNGDWGIVNIES